MPKNKSEIVNIFNYASHYRENIYLKMEETLNCDFYFGNIAKNEIKKINYSLFKKNVTELKTLKFRKNINWIKCSVSLVFKPYKKYLLTGEYYSISTWVILLLNKILRKKTYLWSHGWYGNENSIKKFIKKLYFGLSDGIFLYGDYAKKLMVLNGFREDKLFVVYNSLDYEKQLNIRKQLKPSLIYKEYFKNHNPTLIFIGRLTEVKKLYLVLRMLKSIEEMNNSLNIVFIGDGNIKNELIELSKKFQIEKNCWFYGACYDEIEIGNLVHNADLCISPGNVGLTAIHSLMYGTPVITHDNFPNQMPEFEVIKKGYSGTFFKENDLDDLKFKTLNWLSNNINRNEVRQNCYKIIDDFYNPNYQLNMFKKVLL